MKTKAGQKEQQSDKSPVVFDAHRIELELVESEDRYRIAMNIQMTGLP
jgi:hypothetical protein